MNPEKRFFLKVYRFKLGLRILQMSTRLFCSNICKSFQIDFFFKAGLPPDASRLGSKNKLKSPASIIFLLESKQKSLSN